MKKPIIIDSIIKIPSSQDFLQDVDNFVEKKLQDYGLDKSTIADIAISVTEVVINGIVHGNKSKPEKVVTVEVHWKGSRVEIVVTDQGGGFDPESIENPIEEKNLMKEVGRGIFISKSLMDNVIFDFKPGKGTRVTMTKQI